MYEELVDTSRFDGNFSIFRCDRLFDAVNVNAHQTGFDAKVLRLELMKMQKRAFGALGAI